MERMLRRLLGEDVSLNLSMAPAIGRVLADPGQLEQVVMNLAVNARDAMPEGGSLAIRTTQTDNHHEPQARLVVEDTGVGIAPAALAQIFDPFYTTKDPGKGTGLGLVTVRRIVNSARGDVDVRSEPGAGTAFTVTLPLDRRAGPE
jgi:two-component system, cell cycle sensor histidine kinase and response regulator CckA